MRTEEKASFVEAFGPDMSLGAEVVMGKNTTIGKNISYVRISDEKIIIENGCRIQDGAILYSGCHLRRHVTIGHGAVIGPGVVIGCHSQIWHYANLIRDIRIGERVMVGFACQIDPDVHIGDWTRIQPYSVMGGGARIGRNVSIGAYVCLTNVSYPPSKKVNGVTVEDDAILLSRVTVLPGITIRKRAVVSACSLVTKNVADGIWVMGIPGRDYSTRLEYDRKLKDYQK